MDKKMKETLKELLQDLDKKLDQMKDFDIDDKFSEGVKQPAKLSIEKFQNGKCVVNAEGTTLAMLITLAGLENAVLKKLNVSKSFWELVKLKVGIMEAGDNE